MSYKTLQAYVLASGKGCVNVQLGTGGCDKDDGKEKLR